MARIAGLDYAEATVGSTYGYYMGWFAATIYFPGMTSALAWLSARYTLEFITSANPAFPMTIPAAQGGCIIGPECMALTLVYLCGTYAMNALSPKLAGKFQTSTTVIKMIPLALMAVVGLIVALVLKGQLKSVRKQNQANTYVKPGSMRLTISRDIFLYSHVSRTRKANNSSSGGGRSSGGRSGGSRGGAGGRL